MIELVSANRCTGCNICVAVCPVNVFDASPDGPPVIARQSSCQTCFMCEIYCPVDALFVAYNSEAPVKSMRTCSKTGRSSAAIAAPSVGRRRRARPAKSIIPSS